MFFFLNRYKRTHQFHNFTSTYFCLNKSMKHLSKSRQFKHKNHWMRDTTVCLSHGILWPHWAPGAHRGWALTPLPLPRQTAVPPPTAGISGCAFKGDVRIDLHFVWTGSLQQDHPCWPMIPSHRYIWKGLFPSSNFKVRCKCLQPWRYLTVRD